MKYKHYLFDWGNTLMVDIPNQPGPMYLWPEVKVVDGANEILTELSKTAKCHIVTNAKNSSVDNIRKALERAGLNEYITEVFCYQVTGHFKPSKELFQFIQDQLECEAEEMLMIGDNFYKDITGAIDAGIDCVWLSSGAKILSVNNLKEIIK